MTCQNPHVKYRAFISYSHADTDSAKWLHRGLEVFRIDKDLVGRETATGAIPTALRPIFRDRDDFTAGHALTEQTLAALDASAALDRRLLAVFRQELLRQRGDTLLQVAASKRPVIPLIVDGKPRDPELECFPPALKFKLDAKGRMTKKPSRSSPPTRAMKATARILRSPRSLPGFSASPPTKCFAAPSASAAPQRATAPRAGALCGAGLAARADGMGWLDQDYLREQYYWRLADHANQLVLASTHDT